MRSLPLVASLLFVAAACGAESGKGTIDAPVEIDAAIDAPPTPGGCDYTEQLDSTNDDLAGNGMPEGVGAPFTGTKTICGKIDSTHYSTTDQLVDIDGFLFTTPNAVDVRVDLTAAGAEALDLVTVDIYTGPNLSDNVGTTATFVGDHAVLDVHLDPSTGSFELLVFVQHATAITTPISYKLKITTDQPATRCAKVTAAANYTEQRDTAGNGHKANDMVLITNPTVSLTTDTTDLAEPTAVTIVPNMKYRLSGSSADIAPTSGYKDRDSFELTTGTGTNEIAIRLNWPGTTQDLDMYLLQKDTVPYLGRSIQAVQHEDEFKTFAVKPNTAYWVLVANDQGSGAGAVAYDVSICGATFTP
jgi:hypothetical protein